MKNIIFIAPPAAGKGTQAEMLHEKYGYNHISTGDLLRGEIATGSTLGIELDGILKSGALVSDEIVNELLKKKLSSFTPNDKFILDGYPRIITQAESLEDMFKKLNVEDYVVIYLDVDKTMAMQRATGRIICRDCNAIFHKYNDSMKSKVEGICDQCGGELYQRADDNEETFNVRFETYVNNITPVVDYYKEKGKLVNVLVDESKHITMERIEEYLD